MAILRKRLYYVKYKRLRVSDNAERFGAYFFLIAACFCENRNRVRLWLLLSCGSASLPSYEGIRRVLSFLITDQ